jgi:hypothetical protein
MVNNRKLVLILAIVTAIAPFAVSANAWSLFSFGKRRPTVPLGTRGGMCLIAPGLLDQKFTVLSDRPLFAWKGTATKLTVREFKSKTVIWETVGLDSTDQQVVYGGTTPLKSNTIYEWQLLGENPTQADLNRWKVVSVMAEPERTQHYEKLKELEQKVKAQKVEAIADTKATYLLDQRLWSDALQVLSDVKNPSPEFAQTRKEFMTGVCSEPSLPQ